MPADLFRRLQEAVGFDWDTGNVEKNWVKHAVRYTECEEVFSREPVVVPARDWPGFREQRYVVLGRTALGRQLSIAFTFRGDRIHVISARDMNRKERRECLRK